LDKEYFFSVKIVKGAGKPFCSTFMVAWMTGIPREDAIGRGGYLKT
jgi:hypothetical protein